MIIHRSLFGVLYFWSLKRKNVAAHHNWRWTSQGFLPRPDTTICKYSSLPPPINRAFSVASKGDQQLPLKTAGDVDVSNATDIHNESGPITEEMVYSCNSDFPAIVKSSAFVDKTLLIKEYLSEGEIILVTAPRRFGKSTNMDMIRRFFGILVDQYGNVKPKNKNENYQLFVGNNLAIYREHPALFDKYFAKFPVIYLDFKCLVADDYNAFIKSFNLMISNTYNDFIYLLESDKIHEIKKKRSIFLNEFKSQDDVSLAVSIAQLSSLLFSHFDSIPCIVLIDEYDSIISKAIVDSGSEIDRIIKFLNFFLSNTLKSNRFVERGLINGCSKLAEILSYGANNIKHIKFLETSKICKFYGFTECEVKDLLKRFRMEERLDDARFWFDGYLIQDSNLKIYNNLAILRFLETKKLGNYWCETGGVGHMHEIVTRDGARELIEKLLSDFESNGQGVEIDYHRSVTLSHILQLRNIIFEQRSSMTREEAHIFLQFLTDQGYFTVFSLDNQKETTTIRIPNQELRTEIERMCSSELFYQRKFKSFYTEFINISQLFSSLNENENTYRELAKALEDCYRDENLRPYSEYALERDLQFSFKISNIFKKVKEQVVTREFKQIDLLLETKDSKAILIKLKKEKSSYQALSQIINKKYYTILEGHDNKVKIYLGLSFYNKGPKCTISYLLNCIDLDKAINVTSK